MPAAQGAWEGPLDPSWAPHSPRGSGLGALASVTRGPPDGRRCPSHRGAPPSATPQSHHTGCDRRCLSPCGPLPTDRCPPHRPGPGRRLQVEVREAQIGWGWGGWSVFSDREGGHLGDGASALSSVAGIQHPCAHRLSLHRGLSGYMSCWEEEPSGDQEAWGCWQCWA